MATNENSHIPIFQTSFQANGFQQTRSGNEQNMNYWPSRLLQHGIYQSFPSGSSNFIVQGTNLNGQENESSCGNGMEAPIRSPLTISHPFCRRHSNYRGVTRSGDRKKWEARLGKQAKDAKTIYIGRFATEKAAAEAYDTCLIRLKGRKADTNFPLNSYDVMSIVRSEKFPIGNGASKAIKSEKVEDIVEKSMCYITPHATPVMTSPSIIWSENLTISDGASSTVPENSIPHSELVPVQKPLLEVNEASVELDWDWDWDHDIGIEKFGVWDSEKDLCINNIDI